MYGQVVQPNSISVVKEAPGFVSMETPITETKNTSISSLTTKKSFLEKLETLKIHSPQVLTQVLGLVREKYKGKLPAATTSMQKNIATISLLDAKNLLTKEIAVLLYELTTDYRSFTLSCETNCIVQVDGQNYQTPQLVVRFTPELSSKSHAIHLLWGDIQLVASEVKIKDQTGKLVQISNYERKSYAGIPWNTFRGKLIFKTDDYVTVEGVNKTDYVVINQLSFADYLKGIVESNDQETLEKNKVMALIAKNYALFYLEGKNIHPSIPVGASFQAIDSPEMFQKYAGAGVEKTLTKWSQALEQTKDLIVGYQGQVPILPYFSCSAGFTLSGKEKRGRTDTPWLNSVYDFAGCKEFAGHGVGLAGQGAEWFAKQ